MKIENKKRIRKLQKLFYIVSVFIAVAALVLFLLDLTIYGIISIGAFAIWFLFFQVSDYNYIYFTDANNKILLRYYKVIRFGKGEYSSVEFPQYILQNAFFENSMAGKMTDVTFIIKTKRGMAEYPSVSLTALPMKERKQMQRVLNSILGM